MNPGQMDTARERAASNGAQTPGTKTEAGFTPLDPARVAELNRLHEVMTTLSDRDREQARYGDAAESSEPCLCVPVDYDRGDLSHIPQRVLEIDYGCGDPTQYATEGQTVLDLGSGSGKHCFMISRKVGPEGRVIGIDKTPEMLSLSRSAIEEVTKNLGYETPNVEFRRGHIENLRWNLDRIEAARAEFDASEVSYSQLLRLAEELDSAPIVDSESVDLVVSNCVLNLVEDTRKPELFAELHRVLRRGGQAVISDIVSEVDVPAEMKLDDRLWTGCISGALRRDRFLDAFAQVGFYGIEELSSFFWTQENGIKFYSVTIRAFKGKEGPCWETYRTATYRGPFSLAHDDDGHAYPRGVAVPVCEKTARLLGKPPYEGHFLVTEAMADESERIPFDCSSPIAPERRDLPEHIQKALASSPGAVTGTGET